MIKLENIDLTIPIYSNQTQLLKKEIVNSITGCVVKRQKFKIPTVKALSNINCIINRGDRIGLIGHNGSGKTTFLRLISGIYHPSSGKITSNIDVFPMINKSFVTNIELSGLVAAKAYYLMVKKTDEGFEDYLKNLINFSGLEDYIYLPLKTYSQGMQSRLLFTLLTSLNIECLALDEGFGFADLAFLKKAQIRMKSFLQNTGTLIFASHSESLLEMYCNRGIVFRMGKIVFDGNLKAALKFYNDK